LLSGIEFAIEFTNDEDDEEEGFRKEEKEKYDLRGRDGVLWNIGGRKKRGREIYYS
jgi:hypothetical protein